MNSNAISFATTFKPKIPIVPCLKIKISIKINPITPIIVPSIFLNPFVTKFVFGLSIPIAVKLSHLAVGILK